MTPRNIHDREVHNAVHELSRGGTAADLQRRGYSDETIKDALARMDAQAEAAHKLRPEVKA